MEKKAALLLVCSILMSYLMAIAPQTSHASGTVNFASLLNEMVDRDALAKFPEYKTGQYSSTDHASYGNSWYENNDFDQYIRTEVNNGRTEKVMLDTDGPGAVTRMWVGGYDHIGRVRIYLDNSNTPVIDEVFNDLLRGRTSIKSPLVFETGPDLSPGQAGGLEMMLPIPYSSHVKVTYDGTEWGNYYVIEYRTYSKDTSVATYSMSDYSNNSSLINAVSASLSPISFPPSTTNVYTDSSSPIVMNSWTINAYSSSTYTFPSGAHAIRLLQAKLGNTTEAALRDVKIKMTFDGEQTIDAPLGDFFGSGRGLNPGTTQFQSVGSGGTLTSKLTMPYRDTASITIQNDGASSISITVRATTGSWSWDNRSMHLWAVYKDTGNFTASLQDLRHVFINGTGVYIGDTLSQTMSSNNWWGEGDEKIYVDGESLPSHFGTGTEDYFGYSWNHTWRYQSPWFAQRRVPSGMDGNYTGYTGTTVVNRARLLDTIPFNNTFRFDWENWNWDQSAAVDFAYVSYFYAKPGALLMNGGIQSGAVYNLQSKVGGWNLDVANGSTGDGALMQVYRSNGSDAQQFKIEDAGNGYYKITNVRSGKVLDVPNASTANEVQIQQYAWNGSAAQLWSIIPVGNDFYKIINKNSGKALDVFQASRSPGTRVNQYTDNGTDAQLWRLNLSTNGILSGKTYLIRSKVSGLCLDIVNASIADGGLAQQYAFNDTNAQRWTLNDKGGGYYQIVNVNSGKVLDVPNASTANEIQLQQYTWNGTDSQLWKIETDGGGFMKITNKNSGKVLDVYFGSTNAGARVNQYQWNGTDAQLWGLIQD